jgi:hypothetical protein
MGVSGIEVVSIQLMLHLLWFDSFSFEMSIVTLENWCNASRNVT